MPFSDPEGVLRVQKYTFYLKLKKKSDKNITKNHNCMKMNRQKREKPFRNEDYTDGNDKKK